MAARICKDCGIKFPSDNVIRCRICGEVTYWKPYVSHDPDWEKKLAALDPDAPDYELSKEAAWRRDRLMDAGYSDTQATFLALSREIDLHQAEDMARHPKCGPDLAVQILA